MNKSHKETISIRFISTAFMILAIAIFKPFGLEVGQWQSYLHLLCLFVLGLFSCFITEVILRYIVRMPRSSLVKSNQFSLSNYLETLAIIAFLSFAIGLYWRFKFRNKYLAMELEDIRELNEQLKNLTPDPSPKERGEYTSSTENSRVKNNQGGGVEATLRGTTNESVTLQISHLLFIEAVGNYVKVCHLRDGQVRTDMLRATMKQMEETLKDYPMIVRCHRAFLVNLGQVEQIISHSGSTQLLIKNCHESLPVSRSNMSQVKAAIKRGEN